ncbi:hypothetical protein HBI52_238510 [Parastagonospora nodorum]|nr:hypothetical protein HBH82_217120 [Parastagonospora nodorum]KAH4658798.1 hypothetical protein HBH78_236950 [Parastagonospora nodorum]KAH4694418.1 hypothetical protein HBH67_213620 [Parastagonospora nodorum]KAH4767380.1 hypothetical protein HBH63_168450 [Parastagonospora nodorum]KAH4770565.1 hypothetical protein HBH62_218530 [Parastagonospora nodorum]
MACISTASTLTQYRGLRATQARLEAWGLIWYNTIPHSAHGQSDQQREKSASPKPREVQQAPAPKRKRSETLHGEETNLIDLTSPEKPKTSTREEVIDLTSPKKRARKVDPVQTTRNKDIKGRCALVLYDDVAFREKLIYDTFAHLRQMRPDLLPWKWYETIWTTNKPHKDGSLFGACMFAQAKPEKAYDASKKVLVEADVYYLHWFCSTGCSERHQIKMRTRPATLLGAGPIDQATGHSN